MMQNLVVIDGDISLLNVEQADCELLIPESGEYGSFIAVRESYPIYDGPTEITPSTETQTLNTTLKTLTGNIVVNPIPQNYGLITWNGATLTVS